MMQREFLEIAGAAILFCTGFSMGELRGRTNSVHVLFLIVKDRIALATIRPVQDELHSLYNEIWRRELSQLFGRWALKRYDRLKVKSLKEA